jgi:hypothetical protein
MCASWNDTKPITGDTIIKSITVSTRNLPRTLDRISPRRGFDLSRAVIATFGAASVAWAVSSWHAIGLESSSKNFIERIFSGDVFTADQLSSFKTEIDAISPERLGPIASTALAVVRLRASETEAGTGARQASAAERAALGSAIAYALSIDPSNSFLWLANYWTHESSDRTTERGLASLRMSYSLAPNEAWIAVKRSPIALGSLASLPGDLKDRAMTEFVGLVQSGLYEDASRIVVGSEAHVQEMLFAELVRVNEADRAGFAKVLRRSLDDAVIPGMNSRPSRPF